MAAQVLKLVIVGDSSVGKTSLITRYIKNTFEENCYPTIGTDLLQNKIKLDDKEYRLQIWDTGV